MFDFDLPEPGLYRTTQPMPGNETQFPAGVLVFIGQPKTGGVKFIVRPADNRRNRWFWRRSSPIGWRPLSRPGGWTPCKVGWNATIG